ncbi:hypothetical protein CK1_18080 [Ruminococcus sp. SR1/5]|nr:hypothetical protein CK1_18080 [Ruminococcus sp. SR1/5]
MKETDIGIKSTGTARKGELK